MLTGLELTFMGVTRSNSGLFSTPGFLVSPVGKRESGEKKKKKEKGRKEKEIEKERKEGRRNTKKIGGKKRGRNFNKN